MNTIKKYTFYEVEFESANQGAIIEKCAVFTWGDKYYKVGAFRKGSRYAVRFAPMEEGPWNYEIQTGKEVIHGNFQCVLNTGNNHGKVVADGLNFKYEDGTRYIPFGTTCYAWVNQTKELQDETIETLKGSPFNKIRMCVFPKAMPYNNNEPDFFPYFKKEDGSWDMENPDERFWSNLDHRLMQLQALGIETDLIVYHPYDRWGFAALSQSDSLKYLDYLINRYASYGNLWWSLANEYETVYSKTIADWDEIGETIQKKDIYHHLISVHNIITEYPNRDWMTHVSLQKRTIDRIRFWQEEYQKPVIMDECGYEGDLSYVWGNLSAVEMVHDFWWSMMRGGFCTHGETFDREDEVLWWAKGGKLYGKSPARIAFLRQIIESLPGEWHSDYHEAINPNMDGLDPVAIEQTQNWNKILEHTCPEYLYNIRMDGSPLALVGENFRLHYCGRGCSCKMEFDLDENKKYRVEVIDAWEMTRTEVLTHVSGHVVVPLPSKECMAILFIECGLCKRIG